jgi:hypothetical protein
VAALRLAIEEVATRDHVRDEVRQAMAELLVELNKPKNSKKAK